jgi:hypothetical protein
MIRNISIVWLTFALVLVQAPPKEANGHERNLMRRPLDRLAQDPVIVKVGVLNEETGSFALDLREEDFVIEEDGERQKPTRFLREERPLSILLAIDSKGLSEMRLFLSAPQEEPHREHRRAPDQARGSHYRPAEVLDHR